MPTFASPPLELRSMIISHALPTLTIATQSSQFHTRDRSESVYCSALMRLATVSRSWLDSVCCYIESLQRLDRQDDEMLENYGFHRGWCIETGKWVCEERWWCLHDGVLQGMRRVSGRREEE